MEISGFGLVVIQILTNLDHFPWNLCILIGNIEWNFEYVIETLCTRWEVWELCIVP
jgi:hypothetical protein